MTGVMNSARIALSTEGWEDFGSGFTVGEIVLGIEMLMMILLSGFYNVGNVLMSVM